MSEKDFAIGAVGLPVVGNISKKPCYLVSLVDSTGKSKNLIQFLAIDKPDLLNGFIQVKGVYTSLAEDELVKGFNDLLSSTPKESILDLLLPCNRVYSIRSLVFNANKPSSLNK